ncbi:MAG: hypothetical protein IPJ41_15945 [Phycisphaerales bacterium]|nr:hypothetical protein [Phycisphaerales bacterium]
MIQCAGSLAAAGGGGHAVLLLGDSDAARHAATLGLWADAWYSPPLGEPMLAWRAVLRTLRSLGPFDAIQPWTEGAWRVCRRVSSRLTGGVPDGEPDCRPTMLGEAREAIREALGVGEAVPLVGLLADPPWLADARRFVYMIGLLDVAGIPIAGVADPRTAHLARSRRFHAEAGVSWRLLTPAAPLTAMLHACDLAVLVPPNPHRALHASERAWARWSIARSHALGVPVIAASAWLADVPSPRSCLEMLDAGDGALTEVARRLATLAEDAGGRAELGAALREGTRWGGGVGCSDPGVGTGAAGAA